MKEQNTTLNYIQLSRGIAAFFVLFDHATRIIDQSLFKGLLMVGGCGVDFFFVLSGFIILYINYERRAQSVYLGEYLRRRLLRIYPIYWVYTTVVVGIYVTLLHFPHYHQLQFSWFSLNSLTLIQAFVLWPNTEFGVGIPLPVAWTLSFEIMFYLIFGWTIIARSRLSAPLLLAWVGGILANAAGVIHVDDPFLAVLTSSHNLEFLLGCGAAVLVKRFRPASQIPWFLLLLGTVLLGFAWHDAYAHADQSVAKDAWRFGIPFFLIVVATAFIDLRESRAPGLLKKAGVYLGNASYSIYLTHFITLYLCGQALATLHMNTLAVFGIGVALSLAVGCLGWSYIEQPLLSWMQRKLKRRANASAAWAPAGQEDFKAQGLKAEE